VAIKIPSLHDLHYLYGGMKPDAGSGRYTYDENGNYDIRQKQDKHKENILSLLEWPKFWAVSILDSILFLSPTRAKPYPGVTSSSPAGSRDPKNSGWLKHPPLEECATAEPPCRFCVKNFGGEERKETMYV